MGENVVAHKEKLEFAFTYRPGVNDLYLPLKTRVGVNILISLFWQKNKWPHSSERQKIFFLKNSN